MQRGPKSGPLKSIEPRLDLLANKVARAAKYIALLALFLAAVSAAAGAVAARRFGNEAFAASALAALLIWLAGSVALLVVASAKTPQTRLNAILLAMLVRLALPMAAIMYFSRSDAPFAARGIGGLIVVHYLAGLALETWFSVRLAAGSIDATGPAGGQQQLTSL
jgi:hypothetical protein